MKRLNQTIVAIALSIPLVGASALAFGIDDRKGSEPPSMKDTATKTDMKAREPHKHTEHKSCGETLAQASGTFERSAALMNKLADSYAAHAEWIGQGKDARAEKQALTKASTAYREMGRRMKTMATTLEAQRDVKDAPHDMSSPKLDRAAQLSMEAAELQAQLADDLDEAAKEARASAEQLQNARAVGGSGEEGQKEPLPDDTRDPVDDAMMP